MHQFCRLIFAIGNIIFHRKLMELKRITAMGLRQKELIAGDHIYVKRRRQFYSHHGIYAGNGQVLHFKGAVREKKDPTVIISDIATFLNRGSKKGPSAVS